MEIFLSILRFIWILFLVIMVFNLMIIVHEWGHFLAARWRGLVVDRFQIWFGKPIWKKTINGVQYGLGTIPAGGFVSLPQMVTMESVEGEVDEEVKKDLEPISPLDKIIVAFAGPLFSFLLAVLFAVIVWMVGRPMPDAKTSQDVGYVYDYSAAAEAGLQIGDKILSVDGQEVKQIHGMVDSLDWFVIAAESDEVKVQFERSGETKEVTLDSSLEGQERRAAEQKAAMEAKYGPSEEKELAEKGWWGKTMAWLFDRPPLPSPGVSSSSNPMVGKLIEHGPGATAGLEIGDVFLEMNGKPVTHQMQVNDQVKKSGGQPLNLKIERNGEIVEKTLTPRKPEIRPKKGEKGFEDYDKPMIGIQWDTFGKSNIQRQSPGKQITDSLRSMKNTLGAIFSTKSKIKGTHLSSAVGIMRLYYRLFEHPDGWRLVLWFSVVLNINLAILNMLPLPILDGGHIVMATTEAIIRRPLPVKFLGVLQAGTFFFLIGLMIILLFKDVGDIAKDSEKEDEIKWGFKPVEKVET